MRGRLAGCGLTLECVCVKEFFVAVRGHKCGVGRPRADGLCGKGYRNRWAETTSEGIFIIVEG